MNLKLNSLRETAQASDASTNFDSILVIYSGDLLSSIAKIPQAKAVILSPYQAVIFVEKDYENLISSLPNINIIEPQIEYILTQVSPLESANITQFTEGQPIDLTGTGVIVGMVDTGIDYLNKEFRREDDTTRILSIWDQTDNTTESPSSFGYGREFTSEQINEAIKVSLQGGDPYAIVPEKDISGHGTQCAGIIGARGYGDVRGAAPNCDFMVVKLRPLRIIEVNPGESISTYRSADIASAIAYLMQRRENYHRPIVVFLPVSSNIGGHNGTNALEQLIDYYSQFGTVAFAIGTGNQGNSQTHASGNLKFTGDTATVELKIGDNQQALDALIWIPYPDKISVSLASPSGQVTSLIPSTSNKTTEIKFLYEGTTAQITYISPVILSGNEVVEIHFINPASGIWKINLFGEYIIEGSYNLWINLRPLSKSDTLFLNSNNFTTLTIPSTSKLGISTAYYDQNTNTIGSNSGVGFTANNQIKPDITCGGVNVLTTSLNNTTVRVSGSSVATAVLAGAIALIYQWGIVDKNLPNMSSEIIKAFLIRGARKRPGENYPNPYWGYGILDLLGVFNALRGIYNLQEQPGNFPTRSCDDIIETNMPFDVFHRLKYD